MPESIAYPLLHVHLGPGSSRDSTGPDRDLSELLRGLAAVGEVHQRAVLSAAVAGGRAGDALPPGRIRRVPAGAGPRSLLAVGRALEALVAGPGAGRRAVQWPAPERWAVVHAHGARALRAVWWAAAWRGSGARIVASPLPGGSAVGPWRKAEIVAAPDPDVRRALLRQGVDRRRLRPAEPGDAGAHLRLYRRLAAGERRRAQRVDWSLTDGSGETAPPGGGPP